jgi:proteasome lid subunit RPN8/RPN11
MQPEIKRLVIPRALWQQISAHLEGCLPEEGCGLLGGALSADGEGRVETVLPVENALHSPVRFNMEPTAQLQALLAVEERGQALLAIFHSHPNGPVHPSVTDRAEFGYPGVLTLILYRENSEDAWQGRAYRIDGLYNPQANVTEIPLAVEIPL